MLLNITHPGHPKKDRVLALSQQADGAYLAPLSALGIGRWRVTLEDNEHTWRPAGEIHVPGATTLELAARQ